MKSNCARASSEGFCSPGGIRITEWRSPIIQTTAPRLVTHSRFGMVPSDVMPPCGSPLMRITNSVPRPVSELKASSEMISEDRGDTISAI